MGITTGTFKVKGSLDLAVASLGSSAVPGFVSVLRGNGDGSFALASQVRSQSFPGDGAGSAIAVAAGVFNQGEAMQDLVAPSFFGVDDNVTLTSTDVLDTPAPSPTILGFSPSSGPVGTVVTINGTNFFNVTVTAVAFNGTATSNFAVNSSTQITATVPVGATTGPIKVSWSGGFVVGATNFVVTAGPGAFQPVAGLAPDNTTKDIASASSSDDGKLNPDAADVFFAAGFNASDTP
jgi:hypothetical protein